MNRLLEQLRTQHAELSAQYDDVLNRCADEGRDPSEAEAGILEGLQGQLEPLGERIVTLRSADDRRLATMTALDNYPIVGDDGSGRRSDGGPAPVVHVRSEELVYRRDGGPDGTTSFFRDMVAAREGDRVASDRLERHLVQTRALGGNTTSAAGVVPPVWLPEEFAAMARGARPIADTLRHVPITSATPVTVGVQTSGAVVGDQAAEGDQPGDVRQFTSTYPLVVTPKTKTGIVDVPRQLVDGSNPAVDSIIYSDLMGAYYEAVETEVMAALANQPGIAAVVPVDTATGSIVDGISHAATAVRTTRKRAPSHVYMTHIGYGALSREKDGAGRPLITTGRYGPQNAQGAGRIDAIPRRRRRRRQWAAHCAEVLGQPGPPHLYVVRADDLLLLESATLTFARYEEVLGPETIRLGVWGYVGVVTGRYPKAIAQLVADAGADFPEDSARTAATATAATAAGRRRSNRAEVSNGGGK